MGMNPRLLRPLATGFDPRRFSGLELWLDASDRSTLFDASTAGANVADQGFVGRWQDKSGNGRHFTQSDVVNNAPKYLATGRNGRGTLEFDGSNDRLVGGDTQYAKTNAPFTAVFAHIVDPTSTNFSVLFSTKTNQTQNFRWINSSAVNYTDYTMGSQANFARTRYTSADRGVWRYVLFDFIGSAEATDASYSARAGKATLTRNSASAYGLDSSAGSAIGSESGGGFLFKGQMAEIVIYSRVLATAERDALENYLTNKWAL